MQRRWTSKAIYERMRESGEHPAELGRRGGLRTAEKRRQAVAKRIEDEFVAKQWWNQ